MDRNPGKHRLSDKHTGSQPLKKTNTLTLMITQILGIVHRCLVKPRAAAVLDATPPLMKHGGVYFRTD